MVPQGSISELSWSRQELQSSSATLWAWAWKHEVTLRTCDLPGASSWNKGAAESGNLEIWGVESCPIIISENQPDGQKSGQTRCTEQSWVQEWLSGQRSRRTRRCVQTVPCTEIRKFHLNQGIKTESHGEKRPFEGGNSPDSMLKLFMDGIFERKQLF